jgi:hypothetical protein
MADTNEKLLNGEGMAELWRLVKAEDAKKAPAYTYGTEDIEAGSASTAPTGTLHFVYE